MLEHKVRPSSKLKACFILDRTWSSQVSLLYRPAAPDLSDKGVSGYWPQLAQLMCYYMQPSVHTLSPFPMDCAFSARREALLA